MSADEALDAGDRTLVAFRRNLVVAASAGTGKTHRLSALYVLLALGLTSMGERDDGSAAAVLPPERIVATTFSRAAAREIARRVERALVGIADGGGHPFEREIASRLARLGGDLDPREVPRRARAALAALPQARFDTLHGVARRIVVAHAAELGQPATAPVLEQHDAEALGFGAVDAALGDALTAGASRAAAARALIAATGGLANARRRVLALCDRLDEEGIDVGDLGVADHAADARAVAERLERVAEGCAQRGAPASRVAATALLAALGRGGARGRFPTAALEPLSELFAARVPGEEKRSDADRDLAAFRDELPKASRAAQAERLAAWLGAAPELADREREVIALLLAARGRIADAKQDAGGLGFGDLLRVARDALLERPEIAAAQRDATSALLVDEFQDTSRVQRDLVYLLRERDRSGRAAGARPEPRHLERHGLFLVGDRKQSIYGFRGADVAVFSRTCEELCGAPAAEALALPPSSAPSGDAIADFVALTTSRRSGGRVLAFVNALAELDFAGGRDAGAAPRPYEIQYGPGERLAALAGREDEGRVVVVRDDGSAPEGADALLSGARGAAREGHVAAAAASAAVRRDGYRPRDVAVLARRRSTIPFVELALARLGVPYVVSGRALYDTFEVRDASALLRLLLDPLDKLALATVLRGPVVALSDPALAALSTPQRGLSVDLARRPSARRAGSIDLDADDRARLEAFRARFDELQKPLLALPPGEALREVVRRFELERVVAALPRAEPRLANLDRIVRIARDRGGTLAGFSRWLAARIDDDTDEAEAAVFSAEDDAVRLTTVHASKGLDFPVVVLVDLAAAPRADPISLGFFVREDEATLVLRHHVARPNSVAFDRDDAAAASRAGPVLLPTRALTEAQAEARARDAAERRRLTYVAVTRAARELVLVGDVEARANGSAWSAIAGGLDAGAFAGTKIVDATELLALAKALPREAPPPPSPEPPLPARPARTPARTVSIATTPLAIFSGCARRFQLRHLSGFEEPIARGEVAFDDPDPSPAAFEEGAALDEPRAIGLAAHRVLERWPLARLGEATDLRDVARALAAAAPSVDPSSERALRVARALAQFLASPYAQEIRREAAHVEREAAFAVRVEGDEEGGPALVVRGSIDLLVRWPSGAVDVLDYKLAVPARGPGGAVDLAKHAFQLRAYALALSRAGTLDVAAAAVHLFGDGQPAWLVGGDVGRRDRTPLDAADLAAFAGRLAAVARTFAAARHSGDFPPVALERCRALGCGFVTACHGDRPPEPTQLDLFGRPL